nr:replication protein [Staphylococcus aureus]
MWNWERKNYFIKE